jgi:hypothetical protein
MEYKDFLEVPIKIGDFVVAVNNRSFSKGVVTGYTPTMVRTSCGLYGPAQLMVSTEQFHVSGKTGWMDSERAKYKDKLDPNKPIEKPKVTWRYLIAIVQDRNTNVWSGVVMKLNGNSQDMFGESRSEWLKDRNYFDGEKAYYLKKIAKGYLPGSYNRSYVDGFETSYSWYCGKGDSLSTVKSHGMENLINNPMPIDQFITSFPQFNLSELRATGKI